MTKALGSIYSAESIHSNWNVEKPLVEKKDAFSFDYPHFNRITHFNKDTAIITGYIETDENSSQNGGYYYENNGPWQLPFSLMYKDKIYNCYDVNFAKFANDSLPEEFMSKGFFENWRLIMRIADYLYSVQ